MSETVRLIIVALLSFGFVGIFFYPLYALRGDTDTK